MVPRENENENNLTIGFIYNSKRVIARGTMFKRAVRTKPLRELSLSFVYANLVDDIDIRYKIISIEADRTQLTTTDISLTFQEESHTQARITSWSQAILERADAVPYIKFSVSGKAASSWEISFIVKHVP